jgi:MFS family permease
MRLIQGTCIGLYCTIVPMLIRELSPLQMAGTFGVLFQFFMGLGTFFCYLLGYLLKILTENIGI